MIPADLSSPVIVLGMHRSGTSLLAGTLEAAGLVLGEVNTAAPHNQKGNREHEALRAVHDKILGRVGASWKLPPKEPITFTDREKAELIETMAPFRGLARWGFKDPRAVWLFDGYRALFPDAPAIGVFRDPRAVARSLMARDGDLAMTEEEGLLLWHKTNMHLLRLWRSYRPPFVRFSDQGLRDPLFGPPLNAFIDALGLAQPETPFYDGALVHQVADDGPMRAPLAAAYDALIACARTSPGAGDQR